MEFRMLFVFLFVVAVIKVKAAPTDVDASGTTVASPTTADMGSVSILFLTFYLLFYMLFFSP